MANITHGMNVDAVIQISGKLHNESVAIQQVVRHVDALLAQALTVWVGQDSRQFDQLWRQHRQQLVALEGALQDLSVKAKANAEKQSTESSHL